MLLIYFCFFFFPLARYYLGLLGGWFKFLTICHQKQHELYYSTRRPKLDRANRMVTRFGTSSEWAANPK